MQGVNSVPVLPPDLTSGQIDCRIDQWLNQQVECRGFWAMQPGRSRVAAGL
jgi:hypothetical protein